MSYEFLSGTKLNIAFDFHQKEERDRKKKEEEMLLRKKQEEQDEAAKKAREELQKKMYACFLSLRFLFCRNRCQKICLDRYYWC